MAESKKSAKAGRNQSRCQRYRAAGRREVNKVKAALRRRWTHPKDRYVADVLSRLKAYLPQAEREMQVARDLGAGWKRVIDYRAVLGG